MELKILNQDFSVCKVTNYDGVNLESEFCFIGKTDEEKSLVCLTEEVPDQVLEREDGWRGFRIQGTLDFSLVGILAKISGILAENKIGIFAVSTYNTDYVLMKREHFAWGMKALEHQGYQIAD